MLNGHMKHLDTPEREEIIKYILQEELGTINEEVQALFLSKMYRELRKDDDLKIFKIENLPQ